MMLLDYFGVFSQISRKMDEISKIWAILRVLRHGVGIPMQQRKSTPRRGMSTPLLGRVGGWSSLRYAVA